MKDAAVGFEVGKLTFEFYSHYRVAERDLNGEPTILRAEVAEASSRGLAIRMKTDYGTREVTCYRVGDGTTFAEPVASPNGGPREPPPDSGTDGGPPSVS